MTSRKHRPPATRSGAPRTVPIAVTAGDLDILIATAYYHGRVMGAVRRVIQMSSRGEMSDKARFVREESYWLRRFAKAARDEMARDGRTAAIARFTPRTLVAFLGRLLAILNTPRSRRRLSAEEVAQREELAGKLGSALKELRQRSRPLVDAELDTRRPAERAWILESLGEQDAAWSAREPDTP